MRRLALLSMIVLAACGDGEEEVPPQVAEARADAARRACVAEELLNIGREDLATVEASVGSAGPVAEAASAFTRAFVQHAELRHSVFSLTDSSRNHAATPADSARYAQAAAGIQIVAPEAGSLEANVFADYERKAATILADPEHPCYWRHELETE